MAKPIRQGWATNKISGGEIHSMIAEAIQKTGQTRGGKWSTSTAPVVGQRSLRSLYNLLSRRKVRGKRFNGHGSWDAYLEAEHGVIPVGQAHWSDERLHWTIATLLQKHRPEEKNWATQYAPVIHQKSLNALKTLAFRNNKLPGKTAEKYFGQGTWKNYVAWLRQNYPPGEKPRQLALEPKQEAEHHGA